MTKMFIAGLFCMKIKEGVLLFSLMRGSSQLRSVSSSLTLFSTPYYSPLSLLPLDPPPFTIPSASRSPRVGQPTVSLSSYPLPDGTWRWVSRAWMVDMRGDGQTQYDGFEYNWFFRSKNWRSEVGNFGAGGWVRRRRWIRLMMRPAQTPPNDVAQHDDPGRAPVEGSPLQYSDHGVTRASSVVSAGDSSTDDTDIWDSDEDENWVRCRIALRRAGRDGRKLELWKKWFGCPSSFNLSPGHSSVDLGKIVRIGGPASSSASISLDAASVNVAPAPKERIAAVLRLHVRGKYFHPIYPSNTVCRVPKFYSRLYTLIPAHSFSKF